MIQLTRIWGFMGQRCVKTRLNVVLNTLTKTFSPVLTSTSRYILTLSSQNDLVCGKLGDLAHLSWFIKSFSMNFVTIVYSAMFTIVLLYIMYSGSVCSNWSLITTQRLSFIKHHQQASKYHRTTRNTCHKVKMYIQSNFISLLSS